MRQEIFQTPDCITTVAVIYDVDSSSVSMGIARAGKIDIKHRKVTKERGIKIALERAKKARTQKMSLCEKNYLRAFYGKIII